MSSPDSFGAYRAITSLLVFALLVAACGQPAPQGQETVARPHTIATSTEPTGGATPSLPLSPSPLPSPVVDVPTATLAVPTSSPSPQTRAIVVASGNTSAVTVHTVTATPPPTAAPASTDVSVSEDALPLIFTRLVVDQKCGHGDIVAHDGHQLYATPRLLVDNSNFLERLPEGSQVALVDCRLWSDSNDISWLVVRTAEKKLGWMIVQPDAFIVTLYPVHLEIPKAVSGIPAGSTIAYVPPSECQEGPVTTEATATSIGVDFIPVVGDLKGLNEAATGCDMVTGERLGDWRWLGLLGIVGLSEVALLRHTGKLADGARIADNLEGSLRYSDDLAISAARNAEIAADAARAIGRMDAADGAIDAVRAVDGSLPLSDEALEAVARFGQPCSFSAETLVATASGPMPISKIKVGEMVLAFDEETQRKAYYPVVAAFAHFDPAVLTLNLDSETILTTPEHPFYVEDEWVAAGDLAPGETVTTADGQNGIVETTRLVHRPQVMYNLTVADAHTYYVGEGEWLVHNACSQKLRGNLSVPQEWADNHVAWQAHHIIPGEFERSHVFVQRAIAGGWEIDGARNGIPLPYLEEVAATYKLPAHRGSHPQYSSRVKERLDELETMRVNENWSDQKAAEELDALAEEMAEYLETLAGQRLN